MSSVLDPPRSPADPPPPSSAAGRGAVPAEDRTAIDGSGARDHRRRRARRLVAAFVAIAAVVVVVVVVRARSDSSTAPVVAAPTTGVVATKTIRNDATYDGTVAHAAAAPIVARGAGRITALAPTGTVVSTGQVLFAVDGVPVTLLTGELPAWRELGPATSPGPDITQLQTSLIALGYDPDHHIEVSDTFTAATSAAVVAWQAHTGQTPTGTVPLGAVVFEPGPVTIGVQHVSLGSPVSNGVTVAEAQLPAVTMQFTLPADAKSLIAIGQAVDVTMPDRSTATGHIQSIGTATDATTGTTSTVGRGTVDQKPGAAPVTDGAAVKVRVSQVVAANVLVVPAAALTAAQDGTWSVTVVGPDRSMRLVPVTLGVSGGGSVQVSGTGLGAGTTVLLPSPN